MALTDRGESLNLGEFFGAAGKFQGFHPHTDCAGGDQQNPFAAGAEFRQTVYQFSNGFPAGQKAGSRFNDDLPAITQDFFTHIFHINTELLNHASALLPKQL
jgi:hypothetical protein